MKDHKTNTTITFHAGFDGGECDCLMCEGMKEEIRHDTRTTLSDDESLKGYITSDLTLRFLDGYKVGTKYEFSCYNGSEQEAEGFSDYYVEGVQSGLGELGYRMEDISSKTEEMDTR